MSWRSVDVTTYNITAASIFCCVHMCIYTHVRVMVFSIHSSIDAHQSGLPVLGAVSVGLWPCEWRSFWMCDFTSLAYVPLVWLPGHILVHYLPFCVWDGVLLRGSFWPGTTVLILFLFFFFFGTSLLSPQTPHDCSNLYSHIPWMVSFVFLVIISGLDFLSHT